MVKCGWVKNGGSCILEKENQELKKQLHESSLQIQFLIEEDMSCPSNCSKLRRMREQQKEFIKLLDNKIIELSNIIDTEENRDNALDMSIRRQTHEAILSKYKEIIGVKDE